MDYFDQSSVEISSEKLQVDGVLILTNSVFSYSFFKRSKTYWFQSLRKG